MLSSIIMYQTDIPVSLNPLVHGCIVAVLQIYLIQVNTFRDTPYLTFFQSWIIYKVLACSADRVSMRKVRDRETCICRIMPVPAGFHHSLFFRQLTIIEHTLATDRLQQRIQHFPVIYGYTFQASGIFLHIVRRIVHAVRTAGNNLPNSIERRFISVVVTDYFGIRWWHGNTAPGNYQTGNTQQSRYVYS